MMSSKCRTFGRHEWNNNNNGVYSFTQTRNGNVDNKAVAWTQAISA